VPAQFQHVNDIPVATAAQATAIKKAAMASGKSLLPPAALLAGSETLIVKPGVERWSVKTGTDADIDKVQALIVDTTVEEMVNLPRPDDMQPQTGSFPAYDDARADPTETTVWRLTADIITLKEEADGDYHLVFQGDSGATMIGEIPLPKSNFVSTGSPWFDDINAARAAADDQFVKKVSPAGFLPMNGILVPRGAFTSPPPAPAKLPASFVAPLDQPNAEGAMAPFSTKITPTRAIITGVGFFDKVHGQTGVAPNTGIEFHPILKIEFP
jgi:hypothetical protein